MNVTSILLRVPPIVLCVMLAGCAPSKFSAQSPTGTTKPIAPLFHNLGDHERRITTDSKEAQDYFDQGLVLLFSFNHDEAIRSFQEAAALDPTCAIVWWGIALANGPHINNPTMTPEQSEIAWEALSKARARTSQADAVERARIDALAKRYEAQAPADRRPLPPTWPVS